MRRRCAVLLTGPAVLVAGLVLASSVGAKAPAPWIYSKYAWPQPTTVPSPATVPAAPMAVSAYHWVQPWDLQGGRVPDAGHWTQPPASVPLG